MSSLHISISAEPVAHVGSFVLTNSILTSLIVSTILIGFAMVAKMSLRSKGKPSRFQAFIELIVEGFRNLVRGIVESDHKVERFTPIIMAFFLFILVNNWFGLLPGVGTIGFLEGSEPKISGIQQVNASEPKADQGTENVASSENSEAPKFVPYLRAGTADLNTTIALALISVVLTQVYGFSAQKFSYFSKFINFSSPMNFAVGLLETVLEFAKIMSFAFRLFGNVFAGEVLLAVMMFLVPVIIPMPFYGMEIFVGFIQALVFSMLSLVFFNMATIGHHDEH
ncbi:MAG: F0F1 ATP synthase subunit A [Candidatus Pacebacteria bacterium]|nr:F0F1 ATP synthase subunit A [Candidatus Paceibacterota bacterium]